MTCIIGLISNGVMYMGCDSRITEGYDNIPCNIEKIWQKDDFLMGIAGRARYINILRYRFDPPHHCSDIPTMKYLCADFVDRLRTCLENAKFSDEDKGIAQVPESSLLFVYKNKIYKICADYTVDEFCNFYSIGSGMDLALGSLEATGILGVNLSPEERISMALDAACKYNSGCAAPYIIKSLPFTQLQS